MADPEVGGFWLWVRQQVRVVVLLRAVARGPDAPWGPWHPALVEARRLLWLCGRGFKDAFGPPPDTNGGAH